MKGVVCVSGMPGAGKSVVSDFFVKKGYQFLRFGQITLDIVKEKKLPLNEASEKSVRESLRKKYGMAAYAILNYTKLKNMLKSGSVVADGLYSWSEYKFFKNKFKESFILVAVWAPPSLRYERISKRVLRNEDTDMRHRPLSKREAKTRDYAEIENLEKGGPIAMADYTIVNDKGVANLFKQIESVYESVENMKLPAISKNFLRLKF